MTNSRLRRCLILGSGGDRRNVLRGEGIQALWFGCESLHRGLAPGKAQPAEHRQKVLVEKISRLIWIANVVPGPNNEICEKRATRAIRCQPGGRLLSAYGAIRASAEVMVTPRSRSSRGLPGFDSRARSGGSEYPAGWAGSRCQPDRPQPDACSRASLHKPRLGTAAAPPRHE